MENVTIISLTDGEKKLFRTIADFLTAKETEGFLKTTPTTLYRWEKSGYLVPVRIGKKRMYRIEDLEKILSGKYMPQSNKLNPENFIAINKTKNFDYNQLLQATSKEFIDWVDEKKFLLQPDEKYPFGENFEEFREIIGGEQSKFSTKQFGVWMELYAETYKCKYKSLRYNKITYFKFL